MNSKRYVVFVELRYGETEPWIIVDQHRLKVVTRFAQREVAEAMCDEFNRHRMTKQEVRMEALDKVLGG